jgi:hypothetical protein
MLAINEVVCETGHSFRPAAEIIPWKTSALVWEFTLRKMAVCYRRFGTGPEPSVRNCHSTHRKFPKERRFHMHRGGSLRPRIGHGTLPRIPLSYLRLGT